MQQAVNAAVASLQTLGRIAQLIEALQTFTGRDLRANPPQPSEKLGPDIGVGATNLDRFIRPWVNRAFREPDGRPPLSPGALKPSNSFAELCTAAGATS
jgi:hypothetical protein